MTLRVGDHWDPLQNFVSATDEQGRLVYWGDSRVTCENNVNTSSPGKYMVTYFWRFMPGSLKPTVQSTANVIVKAKMSIQTQDTTVYIGHKWSPKDNFVSAIDDDGNEVRWGDPRISINGASVDVTKPGVAFLSYTLNDKGKTVSSVFTVTVKPDRTSIHTRDTILKVGQKWKTRDNFVSATDENGDPVSWWNWNISTHSAYVDTSKPGVTHLTYTYYGAVSTVSSNFTVTVVNSAPSLQVPSAYCFGSYKLGDSNPLLFWEKSSKISVTSLGDTQWELSVSLNSESSLNGYLKLGNRTLSEQSQKVIEGLGSMVVTDRFSSDEFIKVDYTGVKQLRKDTGSLEWKLTPSIKEVRE